MGVLFGAALVSAWAWSAGASPPPGLTGKPREPWVAAIVVERESGRVLFEDNADLPWPPASMAKMMTVLVALDAVDESKISLDDPVRVSRRAASMGGSQVFLAEGEVFPLKDLLEATMVPSANDAAMAVAEHVGGSAEAFIERMNDKSQQLGLGNTRFHTVHGLPPGPGQEPDLMSARDLAAVARALLAYPSARKWASTSEAGFRGGAFHMRNTNRLLRTMPGAYGVKTGFTAAAGFELTAAGERDGLDLVAVVLGVPRKGASFERARELLERGFREWVSVHPIEAGSAVGTRVPVAGGSHGIVRGQAVRDVHLLLPRDQARALSIEVKLPGEIEAPVSRGQQIGEVVVRRGDETLAAVPVVADRDVERVGWLARFW